MFAQTPAPAPDTTAVVGTLGGKDFTVADVQKALATCGIEEAAVSTVGANLEEAFVAIVSGPADVSGPANSSPAVA